RGERLPAALRSPGYPPARAHARAPEAAGALPRGLGGRADRRPGTDRAGRSRGTGPGLHGGHGGPTASAAPGSRALPGAPAVRGVHSRDAPAASRAGPAPGTAGDRAAVHRTVLRAATGLSRLRTTRRLDSAHHDC